MAGSEAPTAAGTLGTGRSAPCLLWARRCCESGLLSMSHRCGESSPEIVAPQALAF